MAGNTLDRVGLKVFLRALSYNSLRTGVGTYLGAYRGRICSGAEIMDWVYADREDGGPENPANGLRVTICHLRHDGAKIEGHRQRGYRLAP